MRVVTISPWLQWVVVIGYLLCQSSLEGGMGSSVLGCMISRPVVFTIYLKEEEVATFDRFLLQPNSSVLCYPHIQIFTYVASEGSFFHKNYPINILRNIGIHHVSTSHFVLVDIDMWFSCIFSNHFVNRFVVRGFDGVAFSYY